MRQLVVFLLPPPDGMLVHLRVTPQQYFCQYLFIPLGGERYHEMKVSEHNTMVAGLEPVVLAL